MANEYVENRNEILGIDEVTGETRRIRTNENGELIISSADLPAILSTLQGELTATLTGSIAGTKEIVTVADSAVGLTALTYGTKTKAMLQVQDAPIRYWQTNDAPTATEGVLAQIGDVIYLDTNADISHFKAIRTTATSAKLACQYSV